MTTLDADATDMLMWSCLGDTLFQTRTVKTKLAVSEPEPS